MLRIITLLFLAIAGITPGPATAGSSEAGKPQLPAAQVAHFANRMQLVLAERGAHVAIVARMGRNPNTLPEGVKYTHVAYWVYSKLTQADGTTAFGYQVYNLYQDDKDPTLSHLVQDSPADFFAGAYRLDAGIIIPDERLQKKLLKVIAGPTYAALHNPQYSVLANPETSQFQNCTEHTLDVLMASLYGTSDKGRIKANIAAHFKSTPIPVGGFKRAFATVASRALTTTDHGSTVATATFSSIARFMKDNKLAAQVFRLTPQSAYPF